MSELIKFNDALLPARLVYYVYTHVKLFFFSMLFHLFIPSRINANCTQQQGLKVVSSHRNEVKSLSPIVDPLGCVCCGLKIACFSTMELYVTRVVCIVWFADCRSDARMRVGLLCRSR